MVTLSAGFAGDNFGASGPVPGRRPEHAQPVRWALVARARAGVRSGLYDRPGLAEAAAARALSSAPAPSRTRAAGLLASERRSDRSRPRPRGSLG